MQRDERYTGPTCHLPDHTHVNVQLAEEAQVVRLKDAQGFGKNRSERLEIFDDEAAPVFCPGDDLVHGRVAYQLPRAPAVENGKKKNG